MDIDSILKKLDIAPDAGKYSGGFYVIPIEDSNAFARMYTKLENNAVNTEYPSFGKNTNNATVKVTNYFELDDDGKTYNLFLIGNLDEDEYYLKIGEKK